MAINLPECVDEGGVLRRALQGGDRGVQSAHFADARSSLGGHGEEAGGGLRATVSRDSLLHVKVCGHGMQRPRLYALRWIFKMGVML